MLLGTCLLESLKANTKDGTEKNEKRTKETMNIEYLVKGLFPLQAIIQLRENLFQ